MKTETITLRYPTSATAAQKLIHLDDEFVGTPDYMGLAYFWHHDYRHALRDCDRIIRVMVHDAFVKAGLAVDGNTPQHTEIVARFCPGWI